VFAAQSIGLASGERAAVKGGFDTKSDTAAHVSVDAAEWVSRGKIYA
jgi:hypothetical protein